MERSRHGTDEAAFTSKQESNWKIPEDHDESRDNPIVSLEPEQDQQLASRRFSSM